MCSSFITCNHIVYMLLYSSLQINLPECVTKRYGHSITAYHISNNRVWIIINGGASERIQSRNTHILVTGCDVTNIVELGMIINIM